MTPFCPLVVGAPRSGFSLLGSVLQELMGLGAAKADLRLALLREAEAALGGHVADGIVEAFAAAGAAADLVYNGNFRRMLGGPRWAGDLRPGRACFRKYIGARGRGDFTLITSHPVAVLDIDDVVHSHADPAWWLEQPDFARHTRHASIRDPAGTVNSACFSLNALASEYIQRFMRRDEDNDRVRQELALYKLSDPRFFDGLVAYYVDYYRKYLAVRGAYAEMRWEALILEPVETILGVARAAGTPATPRLAAAIWARISHRNLTGDHRHNFRAGKGIVGDWRNWLTDWHLARMRAAGLEDVAVALGYGRFAPIDPAGHTPFQDRLAALLRGGRVHAAEVPADLFGFAFNKSNIDARAFGFRQFDWRAETRIERSTFADLALERRVWDEAEAATARLNRLFEALLALDLSAAASAESGLRALSRRFAGELRPFLPRRYDAAFDAMEALVAESFLGGPAPCVPDRRPPTLLYSAGAYNVVAHRGAIFAVPQALGPMDLAAVDARTLPGVVVADTVEAVDARLAALAAAA